MKIVIDTNILFSALLNPDSVIGSILMNISNQFDFYAPETLKYELEYYSDKIIKYSKLEKSDISELKTKFFKCINFVNEDFISENSWKEAFDVMKEVDEKDTPFLALAIELSAKIWTGDKKFQSAIENFNSNLIMSTKELVKS